MKNYQKLYFKHYYAILNDGTRVEVTRRECFAYPEPPTADNPYPQCFYYSPDGDCAIRLPRTAESVELARFNRADLKQEERYQINKANRGYISLDQTIDTDNGEDEVSGLDLEDPDADFQDRAALRHDISF